MFVYKDIEIAEQGFISLGLKNVYGIGNTKAVAVMKAAGVSISARGAWITATAWRRLEDILDSTVLTQFNLHKVRYKFNRRFISLKTYKSIKFQNGLPIRGQRTHTNARTAKRRRRGS